MNIESVKLFIEAFSGLGLFLFGMIYLESQIRLSAGRMFKRLVRWMTSTPLRSIFAGFLTTAVFQSSSVVTLMALSLIGAGLIGLDSAIGIIFGANIGTTVTAWIVGIVGFKMDIKLIAYMFVGIGGLGGVLLSEESRWRNIMHAMVGFGLIFMGLEGMKESFSGVASSFSLEQYRFDHIYWYALLGFAITAVIQSSSASIAIIQSALFAHMVGFEAAAAFVVGANIGTTVTAILGAIGGSPDKKRAATAHFLFNVSTGLIALAAISWLITLTDMVMPGVDDVIRIALFHTIFNLLGVLLWYPFIGVLAEWLKRFFKHEKPYFTKYIHNVSPRIPDVALAAIVNEIGHLIEEVENFSLLAVNVPPAKVLMENMPIDKLLDTYDEKIGLSYGRQYAHIRHIEGEILRFIAEASVQTGDEVWQRKLQMAAKATTYQATAAKAIKDMLHDLDLWYEAETIEEKEFFRNIRYQIIRSVQAFHRAYTGDDKAAEEIENIYKRVALSYQNSMELIADIVKNRKVSSEMVTIAINDLHLSKSFTKSLRNTLRQMEILQAGGGSLSKDTAAAA
ncbi:Na/Pi cotransporter family protein [Hydrogenimonas sp.]